MKLVFIVGCGRSGTHFLRNVLNKHSAIWISTELHFFSSLFHNGVIKATKSLYPFDTDVKIEKLFDLMKNQKVFGTFWNNKKINYDLIQTRFYNSNREYKDLYRLLLHERTMFRGKQIGGEKTPSNLFHIKTILNWFPDARIIHIVRDPRAIFISEINKKEKPDYLLRKNNPFYKFGLFIYVAIQWFFAIEIHKKVSSKYEINYKMIRYNTLVMDHKSSVIDLCKFLDIKFENSMLNPPVTNSSFTSDYDVLRGWERIISRKYNFLFSILFSKKIEKFT